MSDSPNCPNCNSTFTFKSGKPKDRQRYTCRNCDRSFIYDPKLIDIDATSADSDLNSKRHEFGLSLLGVSFGLITTAILFLLLFGLLFLLQLDVKLQPKPNTEKRPSGLILYRHL